jgi:hypothetical protein
MNTRNQYALTATAAIGKGAGSAATEIITLPAPTKLKCEKRDGDEGVAMMIDSRSSQDLK